MKRLVLACALLASACIGNWPYDPPYRPPIVTPPQPPQPPVEPPSQPEQPEPPAPVLRASGERLLTYRGCLANLHDKDGRVIWTPALPGASAEVRQDWYQRLRAGGCTHIPIGPFTPGPAYPGVSWSNPDWTQDATGIRGLVEELLSTDAGDGYGFRPVIFADGGDSDPRPRLGAFLPVLRQALQGLEAYVIWVPAWEPVVGAWRSSDVSWALCEMHQAAPGVAIGYHGSPERLVGSSNPLEPDDPWQGGESVFYTSHCGEFIQIALYQTDHGMNIYEDCNEDTEGCWLDRWQDYVRRIGGGLNGWRVLPLVGFETCAYQFFRGQVDAQACQVMAQRMKRVADKWSVPFHWGNGAP